MRKLDVWSTLCGVNFHGMFPGDHAKRVTLREARLGGSLLHTKDVLKACFLGDKRKRFGICFGLGLVLVKG
jgi:hypothetical protein